MHRNRLSGIVRSAALAVLLLGRLGAAAISVVATTPDLKDMIENICGGDVRVQTMMQGPENHHSVPLKPSFLVMLTRCDVLVVNGMEYEHAFLPGALMAVRNARIQKGASHFIDASQYIKPVEVPDRLDPALGDLHPMGSPHIHIDPGNGILMCRAIYERMSELYPDRAAAWKPRYEAYVKKIYARMKALQELAAGTRGLKLVFYHPGWKYLTDRMGWEIVGYVEARAGIPPTPRQVQELIARMKASGARLIAVEACYEMGIPKYIAGEVGGKAFRIPHHVNAMAGCATYLDFLDTLVKTIIEAAGQPTAAPQGAGTERS